MGMPMDVGIIDTMTGFPMRDKQAVYEFIKKQTKDEDSKRRGVLKVPAAVEFRAALPYTETGKVMKHAL